MKKLLFVSLVTSIFVLSHVSARAENTFINSYSKDQNTLNEYVCARLEDIFTQNYKEICLAPVNQKKIQFAKHVLYTKNTLGVLSDAHKNILGFITFKVNEGTFNSMHIELLAIDKKYQKMGYGSTLLEYATESARQQGIERMDLLALSGTLGFYKKNGFKPVKNFDFQLPKKTES